MARCFTLRRQRRVFSSFVAAALAESDPSQLRTAAVAAPLSLIPPLAWKRHAAAIAFTGLPLSRRSVGRSVRQTSSRGRRFDDAMLSSNCFGSELSGEKVGDPEHLPSSSISSAVGGIPRYGVGGVDLSSAWIRLVEGGEVQATAPLRADCSLESGEGGDGNVAMVRYGVRIAERQTGVSDDGTASLSARTCEEFAVQVGGADVHPLVAKINETLASIQNSANADGKNDDDSSPAVRCNTDRMGLVAQLQLVRTLRPPPSRGFVGGTDDYTTSCVPPPYDASQDSFLVGPLRLELRPLVATLSLPQMDASWDVYHNVSPADTRGHYLLIPSVSDSRNWRDQSLTSEDCSDLIQLVSTAEPAGSALVSFNSVGAGASQNHVHCHLWPSPPPPLIRVGHNAGWDCYPASRARVSVKEKSGKERRVSLGPMCDGGGRVVVSLLNYPCCCVKVSADGQNNESLALAGRALSLIVQHVKLIRTPYNLCLLNRPSSNVDAYMFVRSRERSPNVAPAHKLGSSETMGLFHSQSEEQMKELLAGVEEGWGGEKEDGEEKKVEEESMTVTPMARALSDISYERREDLWEEILTIVENLGTTGPATT